MRFLSTTIKQAFRRASLFSLIIDDELADNEEGVNLSAEDFVDKLRLLSITLLLIVISIMISGENLIERGPTREEEKTEVGRRQVY